MRRSSTETVVDKVRVDEKGDKEGDGDGGGAGYEAAKVAEGDIGVGEAQCDGFP